MRISLQSSIILALCGAMIAWVATDVGDNGETGRTKRGPACRPAQRGVPDRVEAQQIEPPTHVINFVRPHILEAYAKALDIEREDVKNRDYNGVLAWAAKADYLNVPPMITEEVVVLLPRATLAEGDGWVLAVLWRPLEYGAVAFWRPWAARPFEWRRKYEKRPDDAEIVDFLHATNFGNNECSDVRTPLCVVLYGKSSVILQALSSTLPEKERQRRNKGLIRE